MPKIIINTQSIRNELRNYRDKPANAILEYIWNGFDAGANNVKLNYSFQRDSNGVSYGYPDFEIYDDGLGWDVENLKSTKYFLVSSKQHFSHKSLPQGRDGVGRFTFYAFASKASWFTVYKGGKYKLSLESDSLDDYKLESNSGDINIKGGTKVVFNVSSNKLTEDFFYRDLVRAIQLDFCWLIQLYPNKKIFLNNELIDFAGLIKKSQNAPCEIEGYKFEIKLIQWAEKPTKESSKFYFLNSKDEENFKKTTGLNNQSDVFFHAVYVKSDFFDNFIYLGNSEENDQSKLPLDSMADKKNKEIFKKLQIEICDRLELLRKPYLKEVSEIKIIEWENNKILPQVDSLGMDQKEYNNVVKEIFIAAPQLFTNSNDDQRRVILQLFSSLMSIEGRDFILDVLDNVYKLSSEDKQALGELLKRTTLSCIVRAVKEIDDRLNVLGVLEEILFNSDLNKFTKEVGHLQKVLNNNFWIFGEDYRLFASTEGSIKNTLIKFKDEVLRKEDQEIVTKSRKELDLFLTKTSKTSNEITCIVIEIKRPSVILGKKEHDQIKNYMDVISKEASCNGDKVKWLYYLVGCDYNDVIAEEIESHESWGEKEQGLTHRIKNGKTKLYVKKWSDIINVDQKSRYDYLQEKLKIDLKSLDNKGVDEIVKSLEK